MQMHNSVHEIASEASIARVDARLLDLRQPMSPAPHGLLFSGYQTLRILLD